MGASVGAWKRRRKRGKPSRQPARREQESDWDVLSRPESRILMYFSQVSNLPLLLMDQFFHYIRIPAS